MVAVILFFGLKQCEFDMCVFKTQTEDVSCEEHRQGVFEGRSITLPRN